MIRAHPSFFFLSASLPESFSFQRLPRRSSSFPYAMEASTTSFSPSFFSLKRCCSASLLFFEFSLLFPLSRHSFPVQRHVRFHLFSLSENNHENPPQEIHLGFPFPCAAIEVILLSFFSSLEIVVYRFPFFFRAALPFFLIRLRRPLFFLLSH